MSTSTFKNRILGAAAIAALVSFGTPAGAASCTATSTECFANLDTISASNIGTGSQGTVDLKVLSSTEVQVFVSLTSGVLLINTGGPHTPFLYNLDSSLTGVSVAIDTSKSSSTPATFFVLSGSQSETPYGTFTNGIGYNGSQGGVGHGNAGPLVFDVTATGGINLADFITSGGYYFAADVYGTGGNTGGVAAGTLTACGPPSTTGCPSTSLGSTPLPAALPLFATGLGALGLLGWRRKRKTAAIAA